LSDFCSTGPIEVEEGTGIIAKSSLMSGFLQEYGAAQHGAAQSRVVQSSTGVSRIWLAAPQAYLQL